MDQINLIKLDFDPGYALDELSGHFLDHGNRRESLRDLVHSDHKLLVELSRVQRWTLLKIKLPLVVLLVVAVELGRALRRNQEWGVCEFGGV